MTANDLDDLERGIVSKYRSLTEQQRQAERTRILNDRLRRKRIEYNIALQLALVWYSDVVKGCSDISSTGEVFVNGVDITEEVPGLPGLCIGENIASIAVDMDNYQGLYEIYSKLIGACRGSNEIDDVISACFSHGDLRRVIGEQLCAMHADKPMPDSTLRTRRTVMKRRGDKEAMELAIV